MKQTIKAVGLVLLGVVLGSQVSARAEYYYDVDGVRETLNTQARTQAKIAQAAEWQARSLDRIARALERCKP